MKLLALNETPLETFMKSIEHEWIGTRQQQILSDCRQCLEQCSQEGVLYDPSREDDGVFDVLNRFGTVQKDIEESIEKLLCFPPCKISPSYHTLVLRMHSAVKEAIQLKEWGDFERCAMDSEHEIEEFLGVIRQILMLVLICVDCLFF